MRFPVERAEQVKRLARLIGREPFQKRTWAELGYFLASSALACLVALALAALGVAGLALTFVLVGVLVLAAGLRAAQGLRSLATGIGAADAGREDLRARADYRPSGVVGWLRSSFGDWAGWRAVGYFIAKVPLIVFGVWFALSVWVEALSGIALLFDRGWCASEVRLLWPVPRPRATTASRLPGSLAASLSS